MPEHDVNELAALEVFDSTGQAMPLGLFWQERPVVLALVRHFG